MASSIISLIICIIAIAAKAFFKKEADAFESNRPGQSAIEPMQNEDCEIEQIEDHRPHATIEQPINHPTEKKAIKEIPTHDISTRQSDKAAAEEEEDPIPPRKKNERPKLQTPEEAHRAFIYSEIFNRKYE